MAQKHVIEDRTPKPGESVLSTTAAATLLGVSRQAIDQGLRTNRIPGFRNIDDNRLYVSRDYVETRIERTTAGTTATAGALQRAADLQTQVHLLEADRLARAEAEASTLRDVNLMILAAAEAEAAASAATTKAARHLRKHRKHLARAQEHDDEAKRLYREALKQHQFPATVPRVPNAGPDNA